MDTIYLPALNQDKQPITLIWLHGLGVDGSDFEKFQTELNQFGGLDNINLVLPTAPTRVVDHMNGAEMPAWFNLSEDPIGSDTEHSDIEGMNASRDFIQELINKEHQKHPDVPIVVGGFSQGAAMALLVGLSQQKPLLAIVAFSGFLPAHPRFEELSDVAQQIPVFMAHGALDSVVPMNQAENGFHKLNAAHANVEFHQYPMMHELCPNELEDLGDFLNVHLEQLHERLAHTKELIDAQSE